MNDEPVSTEANSDLKVAKKSTDENLAIAQASAIGIAVLTFILAIFVGPRIGPINYITSSFGQYWAFLVVAACCLLCANKILKSVGSVIILFFTLTEIPDWSFTISLLHKPERYQSQYSQVFSNSNIENLGWHWFFVLSIIISTAIAAMLTIARLNLDIKNFMLPKAIASACILTTSILAFFWGTSLIESGESQKFLYQTELPIAIGLFITGLLFVVISYTKGIEFWVVAALFSSINLLSTGGRLRYGLSDHPVSSWSSLSLLTIALLISIDQISFEGRGSGFFKPLLQKVFAKYE